MFEVGRASLGIAGVVVASWPAIVLAAAPDPGADGQVEIRGVVGPAPRDTTVASTVIGRDELARPGVGAAELLRSQVGVQVVESGGEGAPATASVRGATSAQLPVYLAGIAVNDDVAGAADLSRIPLWLTDHVEIYRGNAPLEADRLGIGGAIFFEPRWPKDTEAGAGALLGSFGTRGAWAYASAASRDVAVLAGGSAQAAANDYPFSNDHGTLLAPTGTTTSTMNNADVSTYDGWVLARARAGRDALVDAFVNGTAREQGVPTLALVPSREARATFDRLLAGTRAVLRLDGRGTTSLETRTAISVARAVYSDPLDELTLLTPRLELLGERVDQRLELRTEPLSSLQVRGAIDASSETLARDDAGVPGLRARRLASRAALSARQWIGDSFSVQALGAASCDGTSIAGTSTCDTFAPTGRAGVSWTEAAWSTFANVGRYVRVPTLGELYGMSPLVRGYDALSPESGVTADAGLAWGYPAGARARSVWGSAGAFARWVDDLVEFVRSSEGYVTPRNVGQARVAGLEVDAGVSPLGWLFVDVAATAIDPRDTTPGRRTVNDVLPFQSKLVLAPRVAVESRELYLGPVGRARAEARWIYQSSRYADAAGLAVIPEQSSLDAEVLVGAADEHWTARLRASDIADSPRVDVVGFPLPGRSFFLSLEAKL
jgi:iron complex outermembrane receptor protein